MLRLIVGLLVLWAPIAGIAGTYFEKLRNDQTRPENCEYLKLGDFMKNEVTYFTFGSRNAEQEGFDESYPLWPDQIRFLFHQLNDYDQHGEDFDDWHEPEMEKAWDTLKSNYDVMDFPLHSVGETLEILAIQEIYNEFDPAEYFVTGSVAYHEAHSGRFLGELDLIVAKRRNCDVVGIGETKMGLHRLPKAHEQLQRFKSFLQRQQRPVNMGPASQVLFQGG